MNKRPGRTPLRDGVENSRTPRLSWYLAKSAKSPGVKFLGLVESNVISCYTVLSDNRLGFELRGRFHSRPGPNRCGVNSLPFVCRRVPS